MMDNLTLDNNGHKNSQMPLISVIVITYNSSATVVETLESIYNQTYPRLELIVSDDKSQDDTIAVCQEWITTHSSSFEKTQILSTSENTGTAGNCNRGVNAASGEWVKLIAGDDLMLFDGIEKLYCHAILNSEVSVVCGTVEIFGGEQKGYDRMVWQHNLKLYTILDSAEEQNWYLMRRNFIATMGSMMKKSLWRSVEGFDEDIPMIEDWPMWIKITKSGHKICFLNKVVAKYRLSNTSVRSMNYLFSYNLLLFRYKYIYQNLNTFRKIQKMTFLKKKSILSALIYRFFRYIKPANLYPW